MDLNERLAARRKELAEEAERARIEGAQIDDVERHGA